jgi:UDP-3-O-[3-hydroxymyristoyl] glucosamine N-acyltransferase
MKSLAEVALAAGAVLPDEVLSGRMVMAVRPLREAGPDDVSFLENPKYAADAGLTKAGAVLVRAKDAALLPEGCAALVVRNPYVALGRLLALLHPVPAVVPGRAASAVVDVTAEVDATAEVGPGVVIRAGAKVGPGVLLGPGVVLGDGVVIGARSRLGAHCVLQKTVVGEDCLLHPGVKVGQDGFGFAVDKAADGALTMVKIPQVGRVVLGNRVEIGANSTVDCGALGDTVLDDDVKLDNLVQIAHNVRLGKAVRVVGQSAVAGSTVVGDWAVIGGQVGIAGHLTLAPGVQIAGRSGVTKSIVTPGAVWAGFPAQPIAVWRRSVAVLGRLTKRRGEKAAHDEAADA